MNLVFVYHLIFRDYIPWAYVWKGIVVSKGSRGVYIRGRLIFLVSFIQDFAVFNNKLKVTQGITSLDFGTLKIKF